MADTVTVGSTGGLQLTLASASMVKCFGGNDGSASVTATSGTPPYQYAWSPGGGTTNTLNGLSAGNYSVQVTDVSGCTVTLPVSITQPDVLQAATSTTAVSCFGASTGAATVTVTGGTLPYTYLWNPEMRQLPLSATGRPVTTRLRLQMRMLVRRPQQPRSSNRR